MEGEGSGRRSETHQQDTVDVRRTNAKTEITDPIVSRDEEFSHSKECGDSDIVACGGPEIKQDLFDASSMGVMQT